MNCSNVPRGRVGGVTGACDGAFVTGALDDGALVTGVMVGIWDGERLGEADSATIGADLGALDNGTLVIGELLGVSDGERLEDTEGATIGADIGSVNGGPGMVGDGGVTGAFDITGVLVGSETGGCTGAFVGCRVI